jgi:hypothetical protein
LAIIAPWGEVPGKPSNRHCPYCSWRRRAAAEEEHGDGEEWNNSIQSRRIIRMQWVMDHLLWHAAAIVFAWKVWMVWPDSPATLARHAGVQRPLWLGNPALRARRGARVGVLVLASNKGGVDLIVPFPRGTKKCRRHAPP